MAENKLGYSVHLHGTLEPAIECPMGKYFVDMQHECYHFEPKDGDKNAETVATIMAAIADVKGIAGGVAVGKIISGYTRIPDDKVKKDGENYIYDFRIEGEMQEYMETTFGSLYADEKKEVFYFDPSKKGFMESILKKKFYDSIKADLNSEDPEKQLGAECVMNILRDWTELDDEDIIREKSDN